MFVLQLDLPNFHDVPGHHENAIVLAERIDASRKPGLFLKLLMMGLQKIKVLASSLSLVTIGDGERAEVAPIDLRQRTSS